MSDQKVEPEKLISPTAGLELVRLGFAFSFFQQTLGCIVQNKFVMCSHSIAKSLAVLFLRLTIISRKPKKLACHA